MARKKPVQLDKMSPIDQMREARASNNTSVQMEVLRNLAAAGEPELFCQLLEQTKLDRRQAILSTSHHVHLHLTLNAHAKREFMLWLVDHFEQDIESVGVFCIDRARNLGETFYLQKALDYINVEDILHHIVVMEEDFVFVRSTDKDLIEQWMDGRAELVEALVRLLSPDIKTLKMKNWPWFSTHQARIELLDHVDAPSPMALKKKM